MSKTINRLLDEAICEFANAVDHLSMSKQAALVHAERETLALGKVNESQHKIDELYKQMRTLAPKGSYWDTTAVASIESAPSPDMQGAHPESSGM